MNNQLRRLTKQKLKNLYHEKIIFCIQHRDRFGCDFLYPGRAVHYSDDLCICVVCNPEVVCPYARRVPVVARDGRLR